MFSKFFRKEQDVWERSGSHYVGDDTILLTSKEGFFVYLDGRDASITPCMLRYGMWEPAIGAFLKKNLAMSGCYVDIGSNVGLHALHAARLVGDSGMVIAFEPQERLLRMTERSICANQWFNRIILQRKAIGASEGIVSLGKFAHLSGSATLTANEMIVDHEEVTMSPLGAVLGQLAEETGRTIRPDVIKIDVEGFEVEVWNGMKEWSRDVERLFILIEYSPVSYRDIGNDPLEFLKDIAAYGFSIGHLTGKGGVRPCLPNEWSDMANARRQFDLVLSKGH